MKMDQLPKNKQEFCKFVIQYGSNFFDVMLAEFHSHDLHYEDIDHWICNNAEWLEIENVKSDSDGIEFTFMNSYSWGVSELNRTHRDVVNAIAKHSKDFDRGESENE